MGSTAQRSRKPIEKLASRMKKGSTLSVGEAFTQAIKLMNAEQYTEAEKICNEIKRVRPRSLDVHNILGAIAFKTKKTEEAATHFSRVINLKADHHEARLNLAKMLSVLEQWEDAARHYQILAKALDTNADVLMSYARIQLRLHRFDGALDTYEKLRRIHPSMDIVETEIAEVFLKSNQIEKAEEMYNTVLARTPDFAPALINLAVVRDLQGRMDDVPELLEKTIQFQPENTSAHFHYALALLTRERFSEGWNEYTWRFRQPQTSTLHHKFDLPFWGGEPLQNQKLLIWTEQGPGDEILALSMLPETLARGADCTLVCSERLAPLFKRSFPEVTIVYREEVLGGKNNEIRADYQASLSHLGQQLRQNMDAFPGRNAYLKADADLTQELRVRYRGEAKKPLVGISWRSANVLAGPEKSTALEDWIDILRTPDVRFVSLQYGDHEEEVSAVRAAANIDILTDSTVNPLKNMDRFAAQVAAMDLVISVSNTTVHVAGAMGRPVWTLVPSSVGRIWYWFLERTNSPWYPSMRLFRQKRNSDWKGTLDEVVQALAQWH